MEIIEVQVTYPDEASAQNAAEYFVKKHLIACVNYAPVQSIYWWKNEIQKDYEYLALFKTLPYCCDILLEEIKKIHPYELPSIIYRKVNTTREYVQWMDQVINAGKSES